MKQPRLAIFDWIRVIAIGLVISDHMFRTIKLFKPSPILSTLTTSIGDYHFWWFNWGGTGVILFLILSGMVLEYNYGNKKIAYLSFIWKRCNRLYPIYWIAILVSLPLVMALGWPTTFKDIFLDVSGLLLFTGRAWTDFFIPTAFFISLIVYLYLFFPLVSRLMRHHPTLTLISLFMISIACRYYIGHADWWFRGPDGFPLCRLFEFGLGIWLVQQPQVLKFFHSLNTKISWKAVWWLSELSFPALLMHSTVLKLNVLVMPAWLGVIKFLELTLFLAIIVYVLNNYLSALISERNKLRPNPPASL